jgi:hypothetical protein
MNLKSFKQTKQTSIITLENFNYDSKQDAIALSILLAGPNGHQSDIANKESLMILLNKIKEEGQFWEIIYEIKKHLK